MDANCIFIHLKKIKIIFNLKCLFCCPSSHTFNRFSFTFASVRKFSKCQWCVFTITPTPLNRRLKIISSDIVLRIPAVFIHAGKETLSLVVFIVPLCEFG